MRRNLCSFLIGAAPSRRCRRNGVPSFNTDRAATFASPDRFKKLVANMKATVIIQHDPRDIGKLPAFPAAK